eukprot:gnl/MRDRNA2_/MRDRNA2_63656_c0_seq4.p1 gnl/MRDRNA2_/MRDRNA2_63656_c0~~gnl/MRDRNA2_/MRDRNA2_63656_c0_seq4.p1  ORF type:complete len:135 (+),score=14.89 gnl/MRDRNA2_/MRDRNA2_63656_c0_seq4:297-701(+)
MVNRHIAGINIPAGTMLWTPQYLKDTYPMQPRLWTLPKSDDPTTVLTKRWWDGADIYVARRDIQRGECFTIGEDQNTIEDNQDQNETETVNRTKEAQDKLVEQMRNMWYGRPANLDSTTLSKTQPPFKCRGQTG